MKVGALWIDGDSDKFEFSELRIQEDAYSGCWKSFWGIF